MNKVIAIIGSTATGKSNLAVQIARLLNGEIINSDSMQVYKGLDVLTNKIDQITLNSVPHHLMSFLEPGQEINVQKFEELALEKISQIHEKNKIPIMCGGTNYYIQSVLFESSLIKENNNNHDIRDELEKLSTPKLLEWLNSVDPELSSYWHPNDRRKIIRSLEVFLSTGKKHSQYIDDSNNENRKQKARFDCLFIWAYRDLKKLEIIIDDRADQMVDKGILDELIDLCEILTKENNKDNLFDHDRGIRQAIGFRAFKKYLKLSIVDRVQPDKKIYLEAINMLKIHTKQYAKNQLKWIRNKLVPLCNDLNIKVIAIDMNEKNDYLIPEILDLCKGKCY